MNLKQIIEYLDNTYTKVEPFPALFILTPYDGYETTKEISEDIITDMYVVKGLTYITIEKEDPTLSKPNILRIFSLTRGLDFPSSILIDDLIEAKYGERLRFFGEKDSLHTILGWQGPGLWRTGVQFLQYELENDIVNEFLIESAIDFSQYFAVIVSSISIQELWSLKPKLKREKRNDANEAHVNMQARYFEICVQEFIRSRYNYTEVLTRYKPLYLNGKEIDVYAKKGRIGDLKTVIICECKLRFENREIREEDTINFIELASKVRQYESELIAKEGGSLKFETWFITNATFSPEALDICKKNRVKTIVGKLPTNWQQRGDWQIINMKENRT